MPASQSRAVAAPTLTQQRLGLLLQAPPWLFVAAALEEECAAQVGYAATLFQLKGHKG
jgi:hypothetical protein